MENNLNATSEMSMLNPTVLRVLMKGTNSEQYEALRNLVDRINSKHPLQAQLLINGMSKLFDRITTEDDRIGSWYQFGSCIITDLQAGIEKRLYVADVSMQCAQSSITGYTDLGNINMPNGLSLFVLNPNLPIDIKGYDVNVKSIDTLKSIPTVALKTARLICPIINGDVLYANCFFAKDQWNLESENPTTFDYRFGVSFPMRNSSNKLTLGTKSNRIFSSFGFTPSKFNEVLYDSFSGAFDSNFKGGGAAYQIQYLLPLAPVDVTIDFGVSTPFPFFAADLATLVAAINADPIINQIFFAADLGAGTLGLANIDTSLVHVTGAIVSTITVGAVTFVNFQQVFDLSLAIDRCHVYSQNNILVGATRNFGVEGADQLRLVLTPITDLVNSASSMVLESAK